jgi:N-acylneuraminate cytidylyltransferase
MVNDKKVLAVIPARGGSKGVPRKNIRPLAGKSLLAWSVEAARESRYIDRLIISSDDEEIIKVAREAGCEAPFVRPAELARDDTPGIEPVIHALQMLPGYDYVVLLQPTSPFRTADDIDRCVELCARNGAPSCVSVTPPDKSPFWMYTLDAETRMAPLLPPPAGFSRRQDLPTVYALNGAVYVAETDWLFENRTFITADTLGCIMSKAHSIDIDTELDLAFCEFLLGTKA